ncbi:hypothetical protein TRFO_42507 [Tritrichomonas foetus]|uniref:Uncharacterized protein n=1 Tax=Tritrichomonas foetus TaxID=1144522 RepID=A0A1J4KW06_9EUKA|nr:hypothetical protein TRFO_42507 [Tritrichomonas foetus]|eukprot:OHT15419.1 hypothetical protein TRFO_42507 [Tritrichomonas foetus]
MSSDSTSETEWLDKVSNESLLEKIKEARKLKKEMKNTQKIIDKYEAEIDQLNENLLKQREEWLNKKLWIHLNVNQLLDESSTE